MSKKSGLTKSLSATQAQVKSEPLQLIYVDPKTNKFKASKEGLKVITNLGKKHPNAGIGLVSVNGMQRTGKSYLLNSLLSLFPT